MNAAERLLALKALAAGVTAAIAQAEHDVEQLRIEHGSRNFETDLGQVLHVVNKDTITFTSEGQLAWAKANAPHEVVPEHQVSVPESVRLTLAKTLEARCKVAGDLVVDSETGEIFEFATVRRGAQFWSGRLTKEAKQGAVEAVLSRLDAATQLVVGQ